MIDLFGNEEFEALLAPVKEKMMEEGFMGTAAQYFLAKVANHLHVAIIMDYTNPKCAVNCLSLRNVQINGWINGVWNP